MRHRRRKKVCWWRENEGWSCCWRRSEQHHPFTARAPLALAVSAEVSRLQAIVDSLQQEIERWAHSIHSDGRRRFRRGRRVPTQETQGQHRDSIGHHGRACATDASSHHRRPRTGSCRCRDEQSVSHVRSSRSQSGGGVTSRASSSAHEEIGVEEWFSQVSDASDAS